MEVHFTPEFEARLKQAAQESGRDAELLVRQLVQTYLDHDQWFRQEVQKGLVQLDRGEFLKHEDVVASIERLFQP